MLNKKTWLLSVSLTLPLLLSACGGGSDDSVGFTNNQVPPAINPPITGNPVLPQVEVEPEEVEGISEILLANDTALPALPNNSRPLPSGADPATIEALRAGVYEYGLTKIFEDFYSGSVDCPVNKEGICPFITKYQYDDLDQQVRTKQWAYMPIQKIWVALQDRGEFISFPEIINQTIDGVSGESFDIPISSSFLDRSAIASNDSLIYNFGVSQFELYGRISSLANRNYRSSLTNEPAVYSANAKIVNFTVELVKGEVLNFGSPNTFIPHDRTYSSLVAFRNAHVSKDNPTCLDDDVIVFNPTSLGAASYYFEGYEGFPCNMLGMNGALIKVGEYSEGVKTIGDSKMLYFSNNKELQAGQYTSDQQYYNVIKLGDTGKVNYGKALQEGYAFKSNSNFYNAAAVKDWLKTKYNDPEAVMLPNI